jgi:hypothetical protein
MICDLCSIQESKEAHKRRMAAERSRTCRAKMTLQQKQTANKKRVNARAVLHSTESQQQRQERKTQEKLRKRLLRNKQASSMGAGPKKNATTRRDLNFFIKKAMKKAANHLHRSKYSDDLTIHRAPVCIICDCFVIGTERIRKLKEWEIREHGHRLSCESYEKYHNIEMDTELRNQYSVNGLPGLLLSPRSRKDNDGYIACSSCYNSMRPKDKKKKHPPKFSIANGFVIGTFPKKIKIVSGPRAGEFREINVEDDNDVSEVLRALVSPVRPYGYVFAYTAGQHESISGHYQFFEMDQPKIGGAMQGLSQTQQSVYAMICGSVTNDQRKIIRERVQIDTQKYVDIMTWLIEHSTKPSIKK